MRITYRKRNGGGRGEYDGAGSSSLTKQSCIICMKSQMGSARDHVLDLFDLAHGATRNSKKTSGFLDLGKGSADGIAKIACIRVSTSSLMLSERLSSAWETVHLSQ